MDSKSFRVPSRNRRIDTNARLYGTVVCRTRRVRGGLRLHFYVNGSLVYIYGIPGTFYSNPHESGQFRVPTRVH